MNKKTLSETDICAKFITPALNKAGWNEVEQIFREYTLRPGRVVVRGSKSHRDKKSIVRADYALFYKANVALAVIEAKDNTHAIGAGMQQGLGYAALLDVPFVFSSNGDGLLSTSRRPIASTRPSCSARTSTTPPGCGRQ